MKIFSFISSLVLCASLASCGGGGGNDDGFSGAGTVGLSVQPSLIDVGDRARVTIDIFEVNEDGVVVKANFPEALSYVNETAQLIIDGDEQEIEPDRNLRGDDEDRFLVFFLDEGDFDRESEGVLRFELQARDSLSDGLISVDIDVDDPEVANNEEFTIEDPQFQPEDTVRIEIER